MACIFSGGTAISVKATRLSYSKAEMVMLLRAYAQHPCPWGDVISTMKDNLHLLSTKAQEYYHNASAAQVKDRLSTKLGKLMTLKNEDKDIV